MIESLRYILPAYFSNASAVLWGKYYGSRRLDLGRSFRGKPLFGSHKTIEGFLGAIFTAFAISVIQRSFFRRPTPIEGFLLGLGAMVGDAFGSFLKRRIGIAPGEPFWIGDQDLFVLFAILFVYPLFHMPLSWIVFLLVITPVIHISFNVLAYKLGLKDVRWRV